MSSCDCLNWCGDDSWLRDGSGRSTPCREMLEHDERKARAINREFDIRRLLEETGHAGDVLAALHELKQLKTQQQENKS